MSDPKNSSRSATIPVRDPSLPLSSNKHLLKWIQKMVTLTQPEAVHWVNGSEEENATLCQQMVDGGTFIKTSTGMDWIFQRRNSRNSSALDRTAWRREVIGHEELFLDLHDRLPKELIYERELLICRL
jgi:GTP-dependent phosphoenolpyruvate carboxykinase